MSGWCPLEKNKTVQLQVSLKISACYATESIHHKTAKSLEPDLYLVLKDGTLINKNNEINWYHFQDKEQIQRVIVCNSLELGQRRAQFS